MTPDERDARNVAMLRAWDAGSSVTEIAAQFGLSPSWAGVLLRQLGAVMPEHRQGVRRDDVDIDEVIRQYLVSEMTVRSIADEHGASYGKIWRLLTAEGVEMRPRGPR